MKDVGQDISEIRAAKDQPSRRKVLVGRRVVAVLGEDEIERLGLKVGARWTESLAAKVRAVVELEKAQREAMKMIAKRARTRDEVKRSLQRKGYGELSIIAVCKRLMADGWLNDAKFARDLAEETVRTKPAGRRLVRERLKRRGIKQRQVEKAIRETMSDRGESDEAMKLAKSLMRKMATLTAGTKARRIASALARRGFDEETVMDVMERLGLIKSEE